MSNSGSNSTHTDTRRGVTLGQKKALRQWFFSERPRPTHKQAIAWFKDKFNFELHQPSISLYIGPKYSYLDSESSSPLNLQNGKRRLPKWPQIEQILYEWAHSLSQRGILYTNDILASKARQIWHQIPENVDIEAPEFSDGWLQGFRARYKIQNRTIHGEIGSIPAAADIEMRSVRTLCGEYAECDIYNIDEIGLF